MSDTKNQSDVFLTQEELAERWKLTVRTIQIMRKEKKGPAHTLIASRPLYKLADVEAYEEQQRRDGGKMHDRETPIMRKDAGHAADE